VRVPPHSIPRLILVLNRVDRRTLEGQQLIDELTAFGECVSPAIGNRAVFRPRVLHWVYHFEMGRSRGLPRNLFAH
jgi:hypothetical protein